jgi:hypothetical protein
MRKIATLFVLAFALTATAQNTETTSGNLRVFSTIGVSRIDKDYKPASGNSLQTTTGLQWQLSPHSGIGAALSFDRYGYEKSGASYNLDGKLRTTALALFYSYKFGTATWQPYLKAGGGTAWLSLPVATVKQSVTNIENKTQNVAMALAEAGVQVRVLPRYSLLLAAERKWMAKSSLADQTALRTTGFKIGLISSFLK